MSVICNFRTTRILSNEIMDFMYLLHERKFVVRNEHVYKIWRTTQLNQYPKNSCISYFQSYCSNCIICEKKMFDLFDKKYKRRLDIRGEYFEGDVTDMVSDICSIVQHYLGQIKKKKTLDDRKLMFQERDKLKETKVKYEV